MNNKLRRLYLFSFILMAASVCGGGSAVEGQMRTMPLQVDGTGVVMDDGAWPQDEAGGLEDGGQEMRRPYGQDDLIEKKDFSSSDARQRWQRLSPEQKQAFREKLYQWKNLGPVRKAEIKKRFQRYQQMPPEMKKKVRRNWERIRTLPSQRRQEIGEKYQKWQHLPLEKKQLIRERYKRFEGAPPEQRQRLRERREQWRNLSPQRKQKLRDEFKRKRHDRRGGYLPQDFPGPKPMDRKRAGR